MPVFNPRSPNLPNGVCGASTPIFSTGLRTLWLDSKLAGSNIIDPYAYFSASPPTNHAQAVVTPVPPGATLLAAYHKWTTAAASSARYRVWGWLADPDGPAGHPYIPTWPVDPASLAAASTYPFLARGGSFIPLPAEIYTAPADEAPTRTFSVDSEDTPQMTVAGGTTQHLSAPHFFKLNGVSHILCVCTQVATNTPAAASIVGQFLR